MFKKPFKVRTNTTIRGSERRKLRECIGTNYPALAEVTSELIPNKEEMSVIKLTTHNDKSITCYCLHKNPIFFELEQVLFPTVYTLWKYPEMSLSFTTFPNVFNNLSGGADLMFAGVISPSCGFEHFEKNTVSSVALLGNRAAVAVGVTTCSKDELLQFGVQGKKVAIYHCYKDQLWAIGDKIELPIINDPAPTNCNIEAAHSASACEDENQTEESDIKVDKTKEASITDKNNEEANERGGEQLSPQEEMDLLLRNCFYQAVINAKKAELPMLVSTFSSQYLHPVCPEGKRIDLKKSSYKKMSKFLSEMQCRRMVEVKEFSKGVESIIKLAQEHDDLRYFKSSEFAKTAKELKELKIEEEKALTEKSNKGIQIRELSAVSGKTSAFFKELGLSKGDALSSVEVRQCLSDYVKKNELADTSNKKKVHLDALLTDSLFNKGQHEHVLTWDVLMKKMLDCMNPCCEVTLPGQQPMIRKGKMEVIEVATEKRMGNKKVTIVKNLEDFGVDLKQFAQDLQQAAASSTTVNLVPGGKNDKNVVLVQGVQTKHVKKLLDARNIPRKYITGLDSSSDKKKR